MYNFLLNDEEKNGAKQLLLLKEIPDVIYESDFSDYFYKDEIFGYYTVGDRVYKDDEIWSSKNDCLTDDRNGWHFIRPVIPYSSISSFCTQKKFLNKRILKVVAGEFPQSFTSGSTASKLENLYNKGKLKKSKKTYTLFTKTDNDIDLKSYPIYEYKGQKYFRYVLETYVEKNKEKSESNRWGCNDYIKIEKGTAFWYKVEPIYWYADIYDDIAIPSDLVFPKIPIKGANSNFFIDKIMNIWLKEIITDSERLLLEEVADTTNNVYNFDFSSLSEEEIIRGAIISNIPVYLHGKSSVGKSSRVKQLDPDCEIVYLDNASKESLIGKSIYNSETKKMEDVPPTWYLNIKEKCEREPNKIHIIFFDELTHAPYEFQNMLFNIVLDHNINGKWNLPLNARIVAAGNEKSESISANEMVEQLFNRFAHVYINTTVDKWLEWAITLEESYERLDYVADKQASKIHPAIYSFVAYKDAMGANVLTTPYTGDYANADPRKWEMASKVLYNTREPEMLRALIGNELTNDSTLR